MIRGIGAHYTRYMRLCDAEFSFHSANESSSHRVIESSSHRVIESSSHRVIEDSFLITMVIIR
ncbi:hypothetical protein CVW56_00630 [Salmonella enterica]|nr:hypothetical protein [Salmonella enterica subsp. enterica serovar Tees]EBC2154845.1 hypothetical protein [Salmonella enterica]EDH6379331.1 hypothetical protein [Salmonella enterica subsp. enterica serovar Havana]EDW6360859.1 hypothetical protein [Salmonella enterica subsp. enterica]HAF1569540.1 hypothetical protein [Salmonella enterica]